MLFLVGIPGSVPQVRFGPSQGVFQGQAGSGDPAARHGS